MEGSEAEDLLLKAIRSLPQGEQDAVMRSLIGRAFAGPGRRIPSMDRTSSRNRWDPTSP